MPLAAGDVPAPSVFLGPASLSLPAHAAQPPHPPTHTHTNTSGRRLDELGAADGGKVLDALVRAASRGVSLRILSAPGLTPLGQAEVDEIVAAGAKVTTRTLDMGAWFGSGILHMKLMVADSEQFYTGRCE